MAINTRNRRASCLGFCFPSRAVWPNPDASLAFAGDRQQMAHAYAAEAEAQPAPTVEPDAVIRGWPFFPKGKERERKQEQATRYQYTGSGGYHLTGVAACHFTPEPQRATYAGSGDYVFAGQAGLRQRRVAPGAGAIEFAGQGRMTWHMAPWREADLMRKWQRRHEDSLLLEMLLK